MGRHGSSPHLQGGRTGSGKGTPSRGRRRIRRLRLRSPSAARQLEASLPPLAFAYDDLQGRAATLDPTTVLTTTVTPIAVPPTPPTRPFATDLAWLRRLPAPGSVGVRVRVVPLDRSLMGAPRPVESRGGKGSAAPRCENFLYCYRGVGGERFPNPFRRGGVTLPVAEHVRSRVEEGGVGRFEGIPAGHGL